MDLEIKTFKCIICKRKRQAVPGFTGPVCIHCDRTMAYKAKGREVIKKGENYINIRMSPRLINNCQPDPSDLDQLNKITKGLGIRTYFTQWLRQKGQCSRCHHAHSQLRCVYYFNKPVLKTLVCQTCLDKPLIKQQKQPKPYDWKKEMWKRADPILRLALASSPTFTGKLPEGLTTA